MLQPNLVFFLSGSIEQPENIYSYILMVSGQAWEKQEDKINIICNYDQHLSPWISQPRHE